MPPSADRTEAGKDVIQSLKNTLGPARYKKLRVLTKAFAMGNTPPERYVNNIATLFDQGLGDEAFWNLIPSLIIDIPNEKSVNSAMHYLERLRMVHEMQKVELGSNNSTTSWANNDSSSGDATSNNAPTGLKKSKKGKSKREAELRALAFGI